MDDNSGQSFKELSHESTYCVTYMKLNFVGTITIVALFVTSVIGIRIVLSIFNVGYKISKENILVTDLKRYGQKT